MFKDTLKTIFSDIGASLEEAFSSSSVESDIARTVSELRGLTTDDDDKIIQLRALRIYLSLAKHAKSQGTIRLSGSKGPDKSLKIRLK